MAEHDALAKVMAQAQVFASAWSLVGGTFDSGNGMADAEAAKEELREMIKATLTAQALPAAEPAKGFPEQHARDSAELRRLCQERDQARRERDLGRVEIAGLNSSIGHLSALVDHQTNLLAQGMQVMKILHASATPDDSSDDMAAIIPGAAFARFVDDHARLMHLIHIGPVGTSQTARVEQCSPCRDFDAEAVCPQCRVIPAADALTAAQQAAALQPPQPAGGDEC